jgi:hypothetical protein
MSRIRILPSMLPNVNPAMLGTTMTPCMHHYGTPIQRVGNQVWWIALRDIVPGQEKRDILSTAKNSVEASKISHTTRHCRQRRSAVNPPYNPCVPSRIHPPEREHTNEMENTTVVGPSSALSAHEYQQCPHRVREVDSGVSWSHWDGIC